MKKGNQNTNTFWLFLVWMFLGSFQGIAQTQISYHKNYDKATKCESLKDENFQIIKNSRIDFGEDSAYHWCRIDILNTQKSAKYYIEIDFIWLDSIYFYNDKCQLLSKVSWKTPPNKRPYDHQNFLQPIVAKALGKTTYYCKMYRQQMVITGKINVYDEKTFLNLRSKEANLIGLFTGILLMIGFFSLMMFLLSKEKIYVVYSIYCLAHLFDIYCLNGYYFSYYQSSIPFIPGFQVNEVFTLLIHFSILLFVKYYLIGNYPLSRFGKKLWKLTIFLLISTVPQKTIALYFYYHGGKMPDMLNLSVYLCFLFSVITSYYLVVYSFVNRINLLYSTIFFIGTFPLGLFSIMIYLRNLRLVEHSRMLDYDAQIFCILFDIVLLLVGLAFRYRALVRERLSLQVEKATSMIQAEEKERSRLSKELHDSIGPLLAIAKIQLEEDILNKNTDHSFENTKATIDEISNEVRNISHDLMPRTLVNSGLVVAIRDFVDRLKTTNSLEIQLDISIKDAQIPKIIETALYRVLQELMTNILKHAHAKNVEIQLIRNHNELTLIVQDDGVGFKPLKISEFKGIGLKNIISRIEFLHGKVNFDSAPNRGTTAIVEVPI